MLPVLLLASLAIYTTRSVAAVSPHAKLAALQDISATCSPSGVIQDCACEYKKIEQLNSEISPLLQELVRTSFFKYVKCAMVELDPAIPSRLWFTHGQTQLQRIDLNRGCNFWPDDGLCMNEGCVVKPTDESDLPKDLRMEALSSVDYSISQNAAFGFFAKKCDFNDHDFCVIDDPHVLQEIPYVNLVKNPERFTGYAGDSAARVWGAIYGENCFAEEEGEVGGLEQEGDQCIEKRVFYRLLSGLHSSISTHICDQWLDQKTGEWGSNLECFKWRLGMHPDRISNMYFTYVVYLRAISKLAPYLESNDWCSSAKDRKRIGSLMKGIVDLTQSTPTTFDESLMFADHSTISLKEEFKNHFRNISLIMDCVGCEKCRLWGKLQITGLGTALKTLFSFGDDPSQYRLSRTELVSLMNGFNRLSNSLHAVERFRARIKDQRDVLLEITSVSTAIETAHPVSSVAMASPEPSASADPVDTSSPVSKPNLVLDMSFTELTDPKKVGKWVVGLVVLVLGFLRIVYKSWTNQISSEAAAAGPSRSESESASGSEGSASPAKGGLTKRRNGRKGGKKH
ncbi:hypothetical protein HDU98_007245 [Podochytrium sp. JEL0797]|nr:hypothetical protein HDU98_007245 [Podochytrium sp. JEL0797]